MTVKEYNTEFLPRIVAARYVAHNLELAIDHAEISDEAKAEVRKHLRIHACWSEETKQLILDALEYYRKHEGIDKLEQTNAPIDGDEKINEILKYVGKLKEIADDLYKYGCEPEDLIIYRMRTYIQSIEELCK